MGSYENHRRQELGRFIESGQKQLDKLGQFSNNNKARTVEGMKAEQKAREIQKQMRRALDERMADNRARGRTLNDGKNF